MRTAFRALLSILAVLAVAGDARAADSHEHVWSDPVCEAPSCVGRCCSRKCVKTCTYPSCKMIRVWSETNCSNEGGATGQYSTPPLMSLAPERLSGFGGAGASSAYGSEDCAGAHDWGDWRYGPWSKPFARRPDCEIRTKSRTCKKCGTDNTQAEYRGVCAVPHREEDHDVAMVSTIWGPRPGGVGSDACPPHDLGDERCGPWSNINDKCKIRHCTRQCKKCGSNRGDRYESDPSGCFD